MVKHPKPQLGNLVIKVSAIHIIGSNKKLQQPRVGEVGQGGQPGAVDLGQQL